MYVRSLNYISAAINMFKWKWKEAVVSHIIFCCIVNTERTISVAESSWLTLASTLLFAELPNLHTRPVLRSSLHTPKLNLWSPNYRGRKSKILGTEKLEGAVAHSPTSPDYLPNLHGTLAHDGNAHSNKSGEKTNPEKKVPGTNCSR